MRVLYVVHALPAASLGGTELYTRRLAETLARGDQAGAGSDAGPASADGDVTGPHEVAIATSRGHEADLDGVSTYALPDVADWTDPTGTESGVESGVRHEAVDRRFGEVVAEFDPDVVHLQHLKFLSAGLPGVCRSRGVPAVLTLHDFWTVCHREQLRRPDGDLCDGPESVEKCARCYASARAAADGGGPDERDGAPDEDGGESGAVTTEHVRKVARRDEQIRGALEAADLLVSPSRFLRDQFRRFGAPGTVVHRRNGIDVADFRDTGFDASGPLKVGYAGRIAPAKGVDVLLSAFEAVEGEAELHVFGAFDPAEDPYHADLAAMAGPDVTFHGRYEAASRPYEVADVLVVPSVWYENSPLVVQEAFASGVPVVAGDVGGMAELVTDGEDGLTYSVGDPAALADALRWLVDDPATVRRLREGVDPPTSTAEHARDLLELYAACRDGRLREVRGVA